MEARTRYGRRSRRHNPLRRRSDVVETWTALAFAVLLFLGAPLLGALVGRRAHDEARAIETAQRADRHRVHAEVVGGTPAPLPSVQGGRQHAYRVTVRWTEPGQQPRTGEARVPAGTRRGDFVDVWFDSRGRGVPPPPDGTSVWQHTVSMGLGATAGAAAAVLVGRSVVRRVALRRRLAEWEREWARTGPQWSGRRA